MPRAAGMVKSTASQQQDTIRDMNRPKSWTAGIWRWKGGDDGGGQAWSPRSPGTPQLWALTTPRLRQDAEAGAAGMKALA